MDLFQSSTLKTLFDPPEGDLTAGLDNIQFENLCPGGFNDIFIQLRRRSNLLTATHIAHACYFASLANRIKREGEKLKGTPEKKRSHRLMAEVRREAGLKIGIIGLGKIGQLLANFLMRYGDVYPNELFLSSRQADLLSDLIQLGVKFCKFNNAYVVEHCDIVFICIAPHQIRLLIEDLRGRIKPKVLLYSLILGYPTLKLASLLQHRQFLKPSYEVNESLEQDETLWPIANDIDSIFHDQILLRRICLENENPTDSLIRDNHYLPTVFFALLNILKNNALLNRTQSLRVVSALIFNNHKVDSILDVFESIETDAEYFPDFDLVHLSDQTHLIRDFLDKHAHLRRLFSDTFISHFIQFTSNH